ncbi:RNA polymerase sigma factor [Corynebacterium variabile]|uniref:RNA polymerase sigma factor n=1 Tax=Corynebacterium variabile TaxID=1727 RepID=UPI001D8F5EF6|nr:sigma-70 family RNA polymerase sigma factor [Corynebacterium variabile]HJG47224.1 sigma-70 family RNA polymerase sigma factor [Corynebacterium variabile]
MTAVLPAPMPAIDQTTTDHDDLTDAQLLQRHCDGCRRAYRVLITRHERLLTWTLHHLRIAPEQHADILQDALLKVHRQAASFRGNGGAGPWLRTILTNTALTHLRDAGRRREDVDGGEDGLLDRLRHTPDPRVVDAGRTVQRLILTEAVNNLHPGLREAVVLSDLHGLSMEDVSSRTGVPVGTVKSRLSRARRQLRAHLTTAGLVPTVRSTPSADTVTP